MALAIKRMLLRFGAVALSVLVSVVVMTGPAQAQDAVYFDGFEDNPQDRWSWSTTYDGTTGFDFNRGQARSGVNNGWLMAETGTATFRRGVDFPWWAGQCAGEVWLKPSSGDAVVTLDVWAHDPNGSGGYDWNLRNSSSHRLDAGGYQAIGFGTTPTVYGGTAALDYVITLQGGGVGNLKMVRVDDSFVRCWW